MKTKTLLFFVLLACACVLEAATVDTNTNHSIMNAGNFARPGCQSQCGNLKVPYPFGIEGEGIGKLNCSLDYGFAIICNTSTDPPKAVIKSWKNIEIFDISENELRISNNVAEKCYNSSGLVYRDNAGSTEVDGTTFTFSGANVLTVVGCDDLVDFVADAGGRKGCGTTCRNAEEVDKDGCFGTGCCQVSLKISSFYTILLRSYNNHTTQYNISTFNPCSYAFLGEKNSFNHSLLSDLKDPTLSNKIRDTVPIVLDWVIDKNKNCSEAAKEPNSFACKYANSSCIDTDVRSGGYRCSCNQGYEGNPYLSPGCKDVDECADPNKNDCEKICTNIPGNYSCSCPHGYNGDGRKNGSRCVAKRSKIPRIAFILATFSSLGMLLVMFATLWLYKVMKRRKIRQLKQKFFKRNGGLLLHQQVSSSESNIEATKLFTSKELEKATDYYNVDRFLGQGGQGTVYKGMLTDGRIVAVKKSKIEDESKLEHFINEVVILSQINHRNVVKLHGCCLETEVPLLVYEFIPNGTLFGYIHDYNEDFPLTWDIRVRMATKVAGALSYLHSAASIPIYHRDIKSTNILLDDKYSAKLADFGTSRTLSIDQTHLTTIVQGTFGYLDPEYFQSSQFTDKSDVYSFGVVLVELLTGQKPIFVPRPGDEGRSLATHFILAMEEDRILDILDPRITKEGGKEEIMAFAKLAYRCLNLNGRKRPNMKQVATELDNVRLSHGLSTTEQHYEEVEYAVTDLYSPWDLTSTSMSSSANFSLTVDVEPLIRK